MNILFEDSHILVVEKPAGIATQAGKVTEKDMVSEVNNYLRKADAKSPAFLIHRLDKPVRGILLFAKTKQAAAELNRQITEDGFVKKYKALVEGGVSPSSAVLENYIYKDGNKAVIIEKDAQKPDQKSDVKFAKLEYSVIETKDTNSLLDIRLYTGRFQQIRCQLAYIGHPIVGDTQYGSTTPYEKRKAIGLIAYSLSFIHPITNKEVHFEISE